MNNTRSSHARTPIPDISRDHPTFKAMETLRTDGEVRHYFYERADLLSRTGYTEQIRENPQAQVRAEISRAMATNRFSDETRALWNTVIVDLYYPPREGTIVFSRESRG